MAAVDPRPGDGFSEPDEPIADVVCAFERGERGVTRRPGPSIEELIEASSLGTPEAKAMRARTSPEAARKVMELARQLADPSVRMVRCRVNWRAHPIDDECQNVEDASCDLGGPETTLGSPHSDQGDASVGEDTKPPERLT